MFEILVAEPFPQVQTLYGTLPFMPWWVRGCRSAMNKIPDVGFPQPYTANFPFKMTKDLGFLFVFSDPQGTEITDETYHQW